MSECWADIPSLQPLGGGVDGGSRIGLSEGIETTYEEDADITDTEEELYPAGVDRNQVRSC